MAGWGTEMRAYRPATAGMPFGIALSWAVVDLHLVFWFRVAQLALEVPLEWCNAFARKGVRESEDTHEQNT